MGIATYKTSNDKRYENKINSINLPGQDDLEESHIWQDWSNGLFSSPGKHDKLSMQNPQVESTPCAAGRVHSLHLLNLILNIVWFDQWY